MTANFIHVKNDQQTTKIFKINELFFVAKCTKTSQHELHKLSRKYTTS